MTEKLDESLNDVIANMRDIEDLELSETYSFQETICPGDHYARWLDDLGLMIFGEVLKPRYEEDEKLLARFPWLRLVNAYSSACLRGEVGTEHIANMIPLEPEEFERARQGDWKNHGIVAAACSRSIENERQSNRNN